MISNSQNENGTFSADVKLNLHVGEQQFELGQVGPGLAILRDAHSIDANSELLRFHKTRFGPVNMVAKVKFFTGIHDQRYCIHAGNVDVNFNRIL